MSALETTLGNAPDVLVAGLPARLVARLTGLSARQLRYLAEKGIVVPSVARASQGAEALYGPPELVSLLVIERVRAVCGQEMRLERLKRLVEALHGRGHCAGQRLVTDGGGFWVESGAGGPSANALAALVIDLDAVDGLMTRRLRELALGRLGLMAA